MLQTLKLCLAWYELDHVLCTVGFGDCDQKTKIIDGVGNMNNIIRLTYCRYDIGFDVNAKLRRLGIFKMFIVIKFIIFT